MGSAGKSQKEIVIFLHQVMYGILFAAFLIKMAVISFSAYRLFDFTGLITAIAFYAITLSIGGYFAYKRKHVSTFGRVMSHDLFK